MKKERKIIGVADDAMAVNFMDPTNMGNDRYDGVRLYCRADGKPVILQRSKSRTPQHWQVVDGFADYHFLSYSDALRFCKERGYKFVKGAKE